MKRDGYVVKTLERVKKSSEAIEKIHKMQKASDEMLKLIDD